MLYHLPLSGGLRGLGLANKSFCVVGWLMSYIEKNLISGETVVFRARLHWIVLAKPVLIACVFAALGITLLIAPFASHGSRDSSVRYTTIAGLVCLLIAVITVIAGTTRRSSAEFAVTNKRVILKAGVFQVRTLELFLNKIESVSVDQTLWGRILGYGSIVIHGTGGSAEPFHLISHPLEFRHQVQQQIGNIS